MNHIFFSSIWLLLRIPWVYAVWRWGDWRNWKAYLPTIQYMIMADLLYHYFTFNYPLWRYDLSPFGFVTADLLMMFIVYPCFVVLFLSRFPKNIRAQFIYVGIWFIVMAIMESFFVYGDLIHYYHGWNLLWSYAFDAIIFTMILLHYKKPLVAYLLSMIVAVLLLIIFRVPVGKVCA